MAVSEAVLSAVRSKLNVTWTSTTTETRMELAVDTVSPALASRLGYAADHEFTNSDGAAWGLFLNAVLYEFSDALDEFWLNYEREIAAARLLIIAGDYDPDAEDEDEDTDSSEDDSDDEG